MQVRTLSAYSHSIVKYYLQFVPVCSSLPQFVLFTLSLTKIDAPMRSFLGHGFRGGAGRFRGSRWVTAGCLSGFSRCLNHRVIEGSKIGCGYSGFEHRISVISCVSSPAGSRVCSVQWATGLHSVGQISPSVMVSIAEQKSASPMRLRLVEFSASAALSIVSIASIFTPIDREMQARRCFEVKGLEMGTRRRNPDLHS